MKIVVASRRMQAWMRPPGEYPKAADEQQITDGGAAYGHAFTPGAL